MSKYIIDIPDDIPLNPQFLHVYGTEPIGNKIRTYTIEMDDTEELNSDYINEHFSDLQDDAYNKGYAQCQDDYSDALKHAKDVAYKKGLHDGESKCGYCNEYQRGLDDAWEAAKKIANMWTRIDNDELLAIFGITERIGHSTIRSLFEKQTANEAMLELEAYEEKQSDKIKVGDEVIYNGTTKCIVVRPEDDERYASLIDSDGTHYSADHRECKKTGRHFDIDKILDGLRYDS